MTRQDAINHVLYWDGDAGLSAARHADGYRIEWDAAKPDVKSWSGAYQRAIKATRDGRPVSISKTPAHGWEA